VLCHVKRGVPFAALFRRPPELRDQVVDSIALER
jgi:hypothetical protein